MRRRSSRRRPVATPRATRSARSIRAMATSGFTMRATGTTRQITKTEDAETNPHFTRDEKRVAFTRANNLYVMALDSGAIEADDRHSSGRESATARRRERDREPGGAEERTEGSARNDSASAPPSTRNRKPSASASIRASHLSCRPGRPWRALQLTPDEKYVIASIHEPATGAKHTVVPNFVTESGYTEDMPSLRQGGRQAEPGAAGDSERGDGRSEVGGSRAESGRARCRPDAKTPRIAKCSSASRCGRTTGPRRCWMRAPSTTRTAGFSRSIEATGKTRVLAHDHDDAWIDGPGRRSGRAGHRDHGLDEGRSGHLFSIGAQRAIRIFTPFRSTAATRRR